MSSSPAGGPRLLASLDNQLGGAEGPNLKDVSLAARLFVQQEAGFAQVVTVNATGFPVGRTMVAMLEDDWTVPLVQRSVHRRLAHLAARPGLEIVWVGEPAAGASNDSPHVFDVGLLPPRAVFLRGRAEPMDRTTTWDWYRRITDSQRAEGRGRAPSRDEANVAAELAGVLVRPLQVRAEGFGRGAQTFTWREERWR